MTASGPSAGGEDAVSRGCGTFSPTSDEQKQTRNLLHINGVSKDERSHKRPSYRFQSLESDPSSCAQEQGPVCRTARRRCPNLKPFTETLTAARLELMYNLVIRSYNVLFNLVDKFKYSNWKIVNC